MFNETLLSMNSSLTVFNTSSTKLEQMLC